MYKFTRSLVGLIGVLILVAIATSVVPRSGRGASGAGSSAPTSQTQNVNVVNTPTVNAQQSGTWNVGINGTVAVSNFPSSTNVAITGTPTVGLDFANNTVKFDAVNNTVKIDTTNPLPVRDVDNPARQPFLASAFAGLADGSTFIASNPNLSVPAGKRLVIEQISISVNVPTGQKPVCTFIVRNNFGEQIFDQNLPTTLQGTFGPVDTFQASFPTRIYLDSSQTFDFDFFRTAGNGTAGARVSFAGHFVDVP